MRHAAICIALVLAACRGGKRETTPVRPQTPKEVVASARAAVEQWRQAYEVHSMDALAKLYTHGLDLIVVQDGSPFIGWSSVEGMLKDRMARYKEIHVRLKD